ncbi:condensation domain-containing protein [Streptomyces sp. NPDC059396]|uniref:condensation domain-containing protein n=1 Tax=Streptomyces sp. NPDC059396 TaxID=3346819 RepID=UPI003681B4DD
MEFLRVGVANIVFAGSSGVAPTTWGQRAIWKSIKWLGDDSGYFNLRRDVTVPDGTSMSDLLVALRITMERHEVLRSLFTDTPDGGLQTVVAEGTLPVALYELPDGDILDVSSTSGVDTLAVELARDPFDHASEFGLRVAVVLQYGEPRRVVLVLSHLCADLAALRVIERDLRALLAGVELPKADWQPRDEGLRQLGPQGTRRGRSALLYWRSELEVIPRTHFDYPPLSGHADGVPEPERFIRLRLESPAGAIAASILADRHSCSVSTVLLAASAVTLAVYSGHRVAVLQLIAGNRYEPRLHDLVAPQAENALFVLPLSGATFGDTIKAAHQSALTAYRHSGYDPVAWDEMLREVEVGRGTRPDLAAFFNDARVEDRWDGMETCHGPEVFRSTDALHALAARSDLHFVGAWPRQDAKYFVHTSNAPRVLHLNLMADTRFLPRPVMEQLLLVMESLLVESVFGEMPVSKAIEQSARARRPDHWVLVEGAWCDPDAVARHVAQQAQGGEVAVKAIPVPEAADPAECSLTAIVTGCAADLLPETLHARVVAGMDGAHDAVAPQHYVLRSSSSGTTREGTGRPRIAS